MKTPQIGITLGDPGGIGPEIIIKAFSLKSLLPKAHYVLFGSSHVIEKEKESLGVKFPSSSLSFFEIEVSLKTIKKGAPSKENGKASFLFFKKAVEEARKGTIQALVTAPISKQSWTLAELEWAGHTDFLSQLYPKAIMAFWSEKLKVALLSHHLPLKIALGKIKKKDLLDFFFLLHEHLGKIQNKKYHFLVSGLNPHAGEEGLLGSEEIEEILPALKVAQNKGMRISGPFPPDVVFRNAINQPDSIVIALYHDQGLIPFKLLSFEKGVNITLGLPFVRTSPDHGTAFDIAGKGIANPQSMVEAINLAYDLSKPSS